jgi:hypothetical protein
MTSNIHSGFKKKTNNGTMYKVNKINDILSGDVSLMVFSVRLKNAKNGILK